MFAYLAGWVCAACLLAVPVCARSPERAAVGLAITWDVGFGSNVYVVGSHPDLGSWSPTGAVKLRWTAGNVWTGQVAVQRGTTLEYKFIARDGAAARACEVGNVVWEPGANRTQAVAEASAPPYTGKTVFYYSAWTSAALVVVSGTNATAVPMQATGAGRTPGEFLYRADGVGEAGEGMEFVVSGWLGGTNYWDNPPDTNWNHNYYTTLDVFLLQDGQLYTYWPSNPVSSPRVVTNFIFSTAPGITARTARIYLPRGYDSEPARRYPVLYFQDGTNVFDPGGAFGSWSADAIATREIGQGRMRECILVAVDNQPNRRTEYEPPGDTYPLEPPGHADLYLRFLLDNVRPTLDFNFRTRPDPRNTLVGGSSMGGLFSLYAGYATNVFGGVLAMSPSLTRATNFAAALAGRAPRPQRIYLDTGTAEGQVGITPGGDYWESPWAGYDALLQQGYVPNDNLLMRAGCGHVHNEAAWRERLPTALRFLLPARDEPNELALTAHPPRLAALASGGEVDFAALQQVRYHLDALAGPPDSPAWSLRATRATESAPWAAARITGGPPAGVQATWRLRGEPVP